MIVSHLLATIGPDWLYHPLGECTGTPAAIVRCRSYNWWSGIEGAIPQLSILSLAAAFLLKHNCYEHKCFRIGRVLGDDGHHRCKRHHRVEHPEYANPRKV